MFDNVGRQQPRNQPRSQDGKMAESCLHSAKEIDDDKQARIFHVGVLILESSRGSRVKSRSGRDFKSVQVQFTLEIEDLVMASSTQRLVVSFYPMKILS